MKVKGSGIIEVLVALGIITGSIFAITKVTSTNSTRSKGRIILNVAFSESENAEYLIKKGNSAGTFIRIKQAFDEDGNLLFERKTTILK